MSITGKFGMGKLIVKAAAVAMLACLPVQSAAAPFYTPSQIVTVRGDSGGVMLKYALRVKKLERRGSLVRLGGYCDSACTLYLGMPSSQVCLLPGATFRFHMPYGSTARNNQIAAQFMMRNYPDWVQSWLNEQGGLTRNLKTMHYDYAAQFVEPCETDKRNPVETQQVTARLPGR
jgi:hypothetical protein